MDFLKSFSLFKLLSLQERKISEDLILFIYTIIFLILLYNLTVFILDKVSTDSDIQSIFTRRRVTRYTFVTVAIVSALPIFYTKISYLPTVLAFTSAGFIISIKDITLNLAGWFFIHGNGGFTIGDRIEIDHVKGEVINVGLMHFTLLEVRTEHNADQSSNRLVHIPNHQAIIHKVYVISQDMDFIWDEVYIYLKISSNWEKAKLICENILSEFIINESFSQNFKSKIRKISKNYLVKLGKTTPIVYVTIEEGKIMLSLRYLTHVHQRRQNQAYVCENILSQFKKEKTIKLYSREI